jgi:hypothetical protein
MQKAKDKKPYSMCIASTVSELIFFVNEHIVEGYDPLGAPFMVGNAWHQALLLRPMPRYVVELNGVQDRSAL